MQNGNIYFYIYLMYIWTCWWLNNIVFVFIFAVYYKSWQKKMQNSRLFLLLITIEILIITNILLFKRYLIHCKENTIQFLN